MEKRKAMHPTFRVTAIAAATSAALLLAQPLSARGGTAWPLDPQTNTQTLDVKLGLWEVNSTSTTTGMPAIDTSKMTPEQRARFEAAMSARGGARGAASAPVVRQSCMTKEKLEKESFQVMELGQSADASCKRSILSNTRTQQAVHVECTGQRKSTIDLHVEALSQEKVKVTGHIVAGDAPNPMTVNINADAKWLAASCGNVK
jgi:hypothetical protein